MAHQHSPQTEGGEPATLKDPVCGMTVTPQSSHHEQYQG